ncbi:azole resistance protein 1 [Nemania sp. FL0916]|nr:azole resistance protein 1 [Nemania sp. FL0916]
MTFAAFQLMFGKFYTFFSIKTVFLISIAIFELGSLVCATAPSSNAFIVGRAFAGLGSAGINAGFIIILAASLPLERRPIFVSSYSGMYGVAAVVAPLLGGAFTTKLTWRWCFYINLPIGGSAILATASFFHTPSKPDTSPLTFREMLDQMDIPGTAVLLPSVVILLLVLQWGGTVYPWRSATIISLLVVLGLAVAGFVSLQVWRQDKAIIPPRIIKQRSVLYSSIYVFAAGGVLHLFQYYVSVLVIPESGTRILPLTLGTVIFSLVAGFGVSRMGYYTPFMIFGAALLLVGASLTTRLHPAAPTAEWFVYQLVIGAGAGLGIQQAHTAAQNVLAASDVPTGAVILIFSQIICSTIWLSVGQNVLTSELSHGLQGFVPNLTPETLLSLGATGLRNLSGTEQLGALLTTYNYSLTRVFIVTVGLSTIALVASAGMEWRSVKGKV